MNNSLKNKFKANYENLTQFPSDKLWEKLDAQLDQETQVKKHFVYSKVWRYAAVVLLLVSVGIIIRFNQNSFSEPTENSSKVASSSIEVQNNEHGSGVIKQNISKQEETSLQKTRGSKTEKVAVDFKKNIQSVSPENTLEKKSEEVIPIQDLKENIAIVSDPATSINKEMSAEKIKYVTASELLFEREARKTLQNQNQKLVNTDVFQKPKEVKILGFTVYSDSQQ